MTLTVYSYLKENPQVRGPLIAADFIGLAQRDDVPYCVRKELADLEKVSAAPDDALLWANAQIITYNLLHDYCAEKRTVSQEPLALSPHLLNSDFVKKMYSAVQIQPDIVEQTNLHSIAVCLLATANSVPQLCAVPCTVEQMLRILSLVQSRCANITEAWDFRRNYLNDKMTILAILVGVLFQKDELIDKHYYAYQLSSPVKDIITLCDFCSAAFIQKMTSFQMKKAIELCGDCDRPEIGSLFESMNDIEKAHDARTERMAAELMAKSGDEIFIYHPKLAELAERYGFFLPESPRAMVKRGQHHRNCIATYANKQTYFDPIADAEGYPLKTVSRLFFTKAATLELAIEYGPDAIVGTACIQYKGKFNKDMIRDRALAELRIALVGEKPDILQVGAGTKE